MNKNVAIFGLGGSGREIKTLLEKKGFNTIFILDDVYFSNQENTTTLNKIDIENYQVIISNSNPVHRFEIHKKLIEKFSNKIKFFDYVDDSVIIYEPKSVLIGEGCFIGPNCIITNNIKIGKFSILNRGVHIGHDAIIGDFFSAMSNSIVSGNVKCGNKVYMGNNSSIREKIKICDDVTIGMNAAVVKDISKSGIYVGVPAKFKK